MIRQGPLTLKTLEMNTVLQNWFIHRPSHDSCSPSPSLSLHSYLFRPLSYLFVSLFASHFFPSLSCHPLTLISNSHLVSAKNRLKNEFGEKLCAGEDLVLFAMPRCVCVYVSHHQWCVCVYVSHHHSSQYQAKIRG